MGRMEKTGRTVLLEPQDLRVNQVSKEKKENQVVYYNLKSKRLSFTKSYNSWEDL